MDILLYCISGAIGGLLMGLIGTGIGPIVVPLILFIAPLIDLPQDVSMKVAIATSLSIIICTTFCSILSHHKNNSINWSLFCSLLPGSLIGALAGSCIVISMSNEALQFIFGALLFCISLTMLIKSNESSIQAQACLPNFIKLFCMTSLMGAISNMLGVSDGLLMIPFLNKHNISMPSAIVTATVLVLPVSVTGLAPLCFVGVTAHLPKSLGYIYLPAFFSITIVSVIFSQIGIKMGGMFSESKLRLLFGVATGVISLKMLI